jgi:hypothetical protein
MIDIVRMEDGKPRKISNIIAAPIIPDMYHKWWYPMMILWAILASPTKEKSGMENQKYE